MIKVAKRSIILLITLIFGVIVISIFMFSPEYMYRVFKYGESDVQDYDVFPMRDIKKGSSPYYYTYSYNDNIGKINVSYTISDKQHNNDLESFLDSTNTTSFIIIHNDDVVYEEYLKGHTKSSIFTSFSSVKSIVSLLVGIAIDEGYIESEEQLIEEYVEEFKNTEIGKISIKELLSMRSSINYKEGALWFGDDAKTYYMPNLRELAITGTKIDNKYDGRFHYNNYHPLLLGIIIERSTGKSVSQYFEEKVWTKIGAEFDASWSLDSEKTQFEKMESGLNFRSIDYAKIGSMLLNKGTWNGNSIVSEEWIERSTTLDFPINEDVMGSFLKNRNTGYKYMWYSTPTENNRIDYFAAGKFGQFLYISPENNMVIVRTGTDSGGLDWWADALKEIAFKVGNMN